MFSIDVISAGRLPNAISMGVTPPLVTMVFLAIQACLNNCL